MYLAQPIKFLSCPICLGTGIENDLHKGSTLCYYCRGIGFIGHYKERKKEYSKDK